MVKSLFTAIGILVGLVLAWIAVQALWRKVFADYVHDDDVLAERRECGNCGCTTACERKAVGGRQ
ncbi:MAG: hypothetical protein IAE84_18255 [Saprospiraceae bacterium]|jgi:hypothetical protein|nr:hypothetical protein [Saprospiraceae bacterium]HRD82755.1 hypothetical protein [Saprospiraceae bacterium]